MPVLQFTIRSLSECPGPSVSLCSLSAEPETAQADHFSLHLQTRDEIKKYVVGAPARVGLLAPVDVAVPAGNTGLDPSQTNFFQVKSHHYIWNFATA